MAVIAALLSLLAIPVSLLAWSYLSLKRNKVIAERVGFPILVKWISPINPFWMIMGSTIVKTCRKLNIGTSNFQRMYLFGWEGNERSKIHEELGKVIMIVTPGGNWLCVSDAEVIDEVIRRPKDFRRNMEQMAVLNVYGKNLSTTDDEEWQKHRKVTAITFTESNNQLVWRESIAQSKAMLDYWKEHQPITTIATDTKVFTLNVLAAAIFNKNYPFRGVKSKRSAQDNSYQYRDSLSTILSSIVQIFVFGENGLKAWWTPKSWKDAAVAIDVFRSYIFGLINEEREHMSRGIEHNQHLVAALVRACEVEKRAQPAQPERRNMSLTETEIISNLFVYAFAGNDTTAIVLGHILIDLAAHPETQDWIAEEIHHYLPGDDYAQWHYHTYPKMKRCLAVVYEALRLDHPLNQLVKTTKDQAQTFRFGGKIYTLPPGTNVHLSLSAVHTHPQYWGNEGLIWKPERFITSTEGVIESEVLAPDTSLHFLPWAHGQRICPGKKFSQVELVAALAMLFRNHVVAPQPQPGESMEHARLRLFKMGMDINHEGTMLFEIAEPQKAALLWRKRDQ